MAKDIVAIDGKTVPKQIIKSMNNTIVISNPPTFTKVPVTSDIHGDIMMCGSAVGAYFTGASYDAAKVLVKSLNKGQFSPEDMAFRK